MRKKDFLQLLAAAIGSEDKNTLTENSELNGVWDSMGQVSVLALLDKEFRVLLTMDELVSIKKVSDIFAVLDSRGVNLS